MLNSNNFYSNTQLLIYMTNSKKQILEDINIIANKICNRKIKSKDNLFNIMDSLQIMSLLASLENKYKKKFKMEKILNKEKLDIAYLSKELY